MVLKVVGENEAEENASKESHLNFTFEGVEYVFDLKCRKGGKIVDVSYSLVREATLPQPIKELIANNTGSIPTMRHEIMSVSIKQTWFHNALGIKMDHRITQAVKKMKKAIVKAVRMAKQSDNLEKNLLSSLSETKK